MRGSLSLAGAGLSLLLAAGCGTVEFEAPPGSRVRILKLDEPAGTRMRQKIWYAGWGQWPISNNSTAPLITEKGLDEVRMATDQDLLDTVISGITSIFSFSVRTVYVEGNYPPSVPSASGRSPGVSAVPPGEGAPPGSGA